MSEQQKGLTDKIHLDKSISLGHLITTFTLVIALVVWGVRQEAKIELIDQRVTTQEVRMDREIVRQANDSAQIRGQLNRMEDKLDRVIETRN